MKRKTMIQQARRRSASAKALESKIFRPKVVPSAKVYDRKKQGKPDDS